LWNRDRPYTHAAHLNSSLACRDGYPQLTTEPTLEKLPTQPPDELMLDAEDMQSAGSNS